MPERGDRNDRLLDLVIAWEALLLAGRGQGAHQFALNGATLLREASRTDPQVTFQRFRAAYAARSAIVHGESDAQIQKRIAASGLKSMDDLIRYMEAAYRTAVFWFAKLESVRRPYRSRSGWEGFFWS